MRGTADVTRGVVGAAAVTHVAGGVVGAVVGGGDARRAAERGEA
jgi:hypothetical protein